VIQVNIVNDDNKSLYIECKCSYKNIVKYLVEHGVNIHHSDGLTLLEITYKKGSKTMMKKIVVLYSGVRDECKQKRYFSVSLLN